MGYTYLKFKAPHSESSKNKESILTKILKNIFSLFIPVANPDFENKIKEVKEWYIEYDTEKGHTNREVGIDHNGKPMMIMPWKKNHVFWTDEDLKPEEYFALFNANNIPRKNLIVIGNNSKNNDEFLYKPGLDSILDLLLYLAHE